MKVHTGNSLYSKFLNLIQMLTGAPKAAVGVFLG